MRVIRALSVIKRGDEEFWYAVEKKIYELIKYSVANPHEPNTWVHIYVALSRVKKGTSGLWKAIL